MKPDWDFAPDWAMWLGQDPDGDWYWYEAEPYHSDDGYRKQLGSLMEYAGNSPCVALEPRP